ncbi:MAG: hypothetical protein IT371_02390 [Deltaproteobacteria bacterium]|nr:hypothetical protein [Deltaproteobacteria bacterium]
MRSSILWATLIAVLVPFGARVALADDEATAREAFRKGRDHFQAGRYEKAAEELNRAYALKPHPALLRYLGQTYQKLDKPRQAVDHYKRYLKEAPQAPDKAKIEAKVRELEMALGAEEDKPGAAAPAPAPAPLPVAPSPSRPAAGGKAQSPDLMPTGEDREVPDAIKAQRRAADEAARGEGHAGPGAVFTWLKWISTGVAVTGLTLGIVFNRMAAGKASDLEAAVAVQNPDLAHPKVPYRPEHHDLQESFKQNRTTSIAFFVTGGVAAAAAITFFIVDATRGKAEAPSTPQGRGVSFAPILAPGAYGVAGQMSF